VKTLSLRNVKNVIFLIFLKSHTFDLSNVKIP